MSASSLDTPAAGPAASDSCGGAGADVFRQTFNLRVAAFFIIFACSSAGVIVPVVMRITAGVGNPMRGGWLFIAKAFGAGVILSVGLIHVMPNANETLGDPCLGALMQAQHIAQSTAGLPFGVRSHSTSCDSATSCCKACASVAHTKCPGNTHHHAMTQCICAAAAQGGQPTHGRA